MSCNNPDLHFQHAVNLQKQKLFEEAEKEYREVLRLKPDASNAHYNLGFLLYDLKRYEEAEKEYREAIRLKPDSFDVHYNLGILLYDLKRYEEAEKEYREAIRLKPDYKDTHINLGTLLCNLKRYKEGEKEYQEALSIKPDDPRAHYNLGLLFYESKRYEESEKEYREALRLYPDDSNAHHNLGNLLYDLKRYDEAEVEYQKALKAKKDYWYSSWGLSEVHVEMASGTWDKDLFQDALTELDQALKIIRKNPTQVSNEKFFKMYLLRGYIHTALGDYKEARWDYKMCLKYDEDNLKAKRNLRRINKIFGEKLSLRWMQIPLLSVAGTGLLASCLARFWFDVLKDTQFYAFTFMCFPFIIVGILLPLIRRVKVGKIEMEFEKGAIIPTKSFAPPVER